MGFLEGTLIPKLIANSLKVGVKIYFWSPQIITCNQQILNLLNKYG